MPIKSEDFDEGWRAAIVREIDETAADAHTATTFEEALHQHAAYARLMIGAHQSALSYVPDGDFHAAIHAHSFSKKYERYNSYDVMPTGEGIWGVVVEQKIPMRMTEQELLSHPRWRNFGGMKDARGLQHPPMPGWLVVPILRRSGQFLGVLQLSDKFEGDFNGEDEALLVRLGQVISPTFELQYVNHELERRTEELALAKRGADEANTAKSEFLANVSHEVRTPLNGVLGAAELLGDSALTPAQRDHVHIISESAEALLAIINDILDYSKIEAGRLDLEHRPLRLREHLGDTMKALASRVGRRDVELLSDVPADVPDALIGDPGRLRQVLFNLVGNAIKFTERGEVVLGVRLHETDGDRVTLRFTVADTGIGIPQHKQKAIFDEFVQADASTTRRYGGTGLGLAIASRLVTAMGGEVGLESQEGQGSTFRFSVRFGLGSAATVEATDPSADLRGVRTLIVDDNATNRRILAEMVRSWGLRALTVPGVEAALDELRRGIRGGDPVRLVLSDVQMPESDGFELARAVHDDPALGHPPIVLLTSGGLPDAATADAAGVAASLFKPVKHSELLETIQAVMGVARARTPAARNATASTIAPINVLLAEDSLANQRLAVGMLEKQGHRVTVVGTGAAAVDACMAQPFDVVVMDLQMPEMDGFEAVRAIRQRERETHAAPTPIVALTARAMADDEALCRRAGFDGYLAKPFRSQQLHEALAAIVPSRPAVKPVEAPEPGSRLDWAAAVDAVEGDRVLLGKVVRGFLDQYPSLVVDLEAGLDASDLPAVQRVAHTLGGSLRMFDGARVVDLARQLESVCRDGAREEAAPAWRMLQEELDAVEPELRGFTETTS